MGQIIDDEHNIDNLFDMIYKWVCDRHYAHPSDVKNYDLTDQEKFDQAYDTALGEWLAHEDGKSFKGQLKVRVRKDKSDRRKFGF